MSLEEKANSKEQQKLIVDLFSSDDKLVLQTITELREKGGEFSIKPLVKAFFSTKSNDVRQSIYGLFCDLKDESVASTVYTSIQGFEKDGNMELLLSSFWQSAIQFENLAVFVKIFVESDDKTSFEAFTIIEQNASNIDDKERDNCLEVLKSGIGLLSDFKKSISLTLLEIFK